MTQSQSPVVVAVSERLNELIQALPSPEELAGLSQRELVERTNEAHLEWVRATTPAQKAKTLEVLRAFQGEARQRMGEWGWLHPHPPKNPNLRRKVKLG